MRETQASWHVGEELYGQGTIKLLVIQGKQKRTQQEGDTHADRTNGRRVARVYFKGKGKIQTWEWNKFSGSGVLPGLLDRLSLVDCLMDSRHAW